MGRASGVNTQVLGKPLLKGLTLLVLDNFVMRKASKERTQALRSGLILLLWTVVFIPVPEGQHPGTAVQSAETRVCPPMAFLC